MQEGNNKCEVSPARFHARSAPRFGGVEWNAVAGYWDGTFLNALELMSERGGQSEDRNLLRLKAAAIGIMTAESILLLDHPIDPLSQLQDPEKQEEEQATSNKQS